MSSYTGVVKWFNSQLKENGPDSGLHEGENVSFSIADGEKGPMAINVHKL